MTSIETKQKMLNKARSLFWSKGYNATTMRDIAKAYGCKPANIYNFFLKKEEILYEVLFEEMEQIIAPIKHLAEDERTNPLDQLRFLIESHLKITLSYRRSGKLLFDVALDNLTPKGKAEIIRLRDSYDQTIRKVLRRVAASMELPRIDEKVVGILIASMINRTRLWYHPKKGLSISDLADFIFKFVLHGISQGNTTCA